MSKKKRTKIKPRKRKLHPISVLPVVPPHDAVLVVVPLEKTKHTMWQQFVEWLKQ